MKIRHKAMARAAWRASASWDQVKLCFAYHELYAACTRTDRWHRNYRGMR